MRRSLIGFALVTLAAACQDDTTSSDATRSQDPNQGVPSSTPAAAPRQEHEQENASDAGGDVDAPVPYMPYDVNHVLSTGQSNSVANDGVPVLSKTQPYGNLMFDTGVMTSSSCDGDGCRTYQEPTSFVPLVEGDTFFYPVETMSSGLANQVAKLSGDHVMLVSVHGRSGNSYGCLRKGGCGWWPDRGYVVPFEDGMRQVADAKRIATKMGKSYVVRAVTAIHGEHDHYAYASGDSAFPMPGTDGTSTIRDYSDALLEWQRDYEDGARAITGQTLPVPLFINQYSHWNNVPTTKIAYMQLDAHVRSSGKVVVVGPTYVLGYTSRCLHFTNHGERQLGEYFAKAYRRVVIEGRRWEPLRPVSVAIEGNVVTAKFLVPSPPLVFDHDRVDDPGSEGFEWYDDSEAPPSITNVAITGSDTVRVTLSAPPTGGDRRLRYAYTFRGCSGTGSIARGTLRDSDPTPSAAGYDLYNWAVHFDVPLP
jgi:hypothetical protein